MNEITFIPLSAFEFLARTFARNADGPWKLHRDRRYFRKYSSHRMAWCCTRMVDWCSLWRKEEQYVIERKRRADIDASMGQDTQTPGTYDGGPDGPAA